MSEEKRYRVIEANTRKAKLWRPKVYTLHDLADRLRRAAHRTGETTAEYERWGRREATVAEREKRSDAKDGYGFVGGTSANGHRGRRDLLTRSLLQFDLDHLPAGSSWRAPFDAITCIEEYACICHQTHSSTPEHPRVRMILPLSREVTDMEHSAIVRKVAEQTGLLPHMDKCSALVNQLMFAPSAPSDAPDDALDVLESEGREVDADAVLATYGGTDAWKDPDKWPLFRDESKTALTDAVTRGDPGERTDFPLLAAFCRVYDIHAAIDTYLSDIYLPTDDRNRYYFNGATGSAAALVYDDRYLYSHHELSDPASDGHCYNAFDLVRVQLFGDEDDKVDKRTVPLMELPSMRSMMALARADADVMTELHALEEETGEHFDIDEHLGDLTGCTGSGDGNDDGGGGDDGDIPYFFSLDKSGRLSRVLPAMLAKWTRENLRYIRVLGTATETERFYVYDVDRGVYVHCSPSMVMGYIKQFVTKYAERLVKMSQIAEVYKNISSDLDYTPQDALDNDEDIINFRNGILRLSDLTLLPHTPDILSTIQMPCNWAGEQTETPVFDAFLDTLVDGDEGKKKLLLQVLGVCMSNIPGHRMKKALFLKGKGNCGKTQFRNLIAYLTGRENNSVADLAELEARFGTSELYGKRVVGSPDMRYARIAELQLFKRATGGDTLRAEFKGQTPFNFTFNGVMVFCMNELPAFGGDTGDWVYNRIMVVDCPNDVPEKDRDARLLDKLVRELDGIAYKAVMAAREVVARGYRYTEPTVIREVRTDYRVNNSTVLSFYKECMREKGPEEKKNDGHTVGHVYSVYRNWCRDNSHKGYLVTKKEFRADLAAFLRVSYDDIVEKLNDGVHYKGLALTEEAEHDYGLMVM